MTRAELYDMLSTALHNSAPDMGIVPTVRESEALKQHSRCCNHMADELQIRHKDFDRDRFLSACGVIS